MPFTVVPTALDGPMLIEPRVFPDDRGFFLESYRRSDFMALGIQEEMVQDNHSRSVRGVVRGMHFTVGRGAGKLVRCARGRIFDILVDLRRGSPTYAQWEGFELTSSNHRILYAPPGFAHGFCVVSSSADVVYKLDAYYNPATEREISWTDPDLGIEWPLPIDQLQTSQRDLNAPRLAEIADELPFRWHGEPGVVIA
jgi:dTDP-4-dehydrorhamnose 3,5-epimerase